MSHRILHLVHSLDRYSSASDLLTLLGAVSKEPFEHQVAVLSRAGPMAESFRALGFEPLCLEQRWTYDPTTYVRLVQHLRTTGPQLVHTWDAPSRRFAEVALPWAGNPRLVSQIGFAPLGGSPWRFPLPHRWRHAPDQLVTASDAARQAMLPQSDSPASCCVIPPGVGLPKAAPLSRGEMLAKFQLPDDAKLIAVAGPLYPRYGVKELIWAADMVRVLHPTLRMLVIGDGPERGHLERFARTAAVPKHIVFLGDTDCWPDIVGHLDAYWQGTEAHATSPLTMLEAMAAGVPVVASDTPEHREWIHNSSTGYLVGIDARAERTRVTDHLLTNIDTAAAIGKASQLRAQEHFSLTTRAENFAALYSELFS